MWRPSMCSGHSAVCFAVLLPVLLPFSMLPHHRSCRTPACRAQHVLLGVLLVLCVFHSLNKLLLLFAAAAV
jgi:hypothetical protein